MGEKQRVILKKEGKKKGNSGTDETRSSMKERYGREMKETQREVRARNEVAGTVDRGTNEGRRFENTR